MKVTTLAVLVFASCIVAKNIIFLDDLLTAVEKTKRAPLNVIALDELRAALAASDHDADGDSAKRLEQKAKRDTQQRLMASKPALQSLLPQIPTISIFLGYLRDNADILARLDLAPLTLFIAPSDDAISKFSTETGLKPWEYSQPLKGDDTDEQVAAENIARFVKTHTAYDIKVDSDVIHSTLLEGDSFTVEFVPESQTYSVHINGQTLAVLSTHEADNGLVFVIESVLLPLKA